MNPNFWSRNWSEDKWEFYYYVEGQLGEKPSDEHFITLIDRDIGYIEGNLRWSTMRELNRERLKPTGLVNSKTYSVWSIVKNRFGCVDRWNSFRNFLEDVGVKEEGSFHYRPDKNRPYGPDNFKWGYVEGGRGKNGNKDYQSWWRRKYTKPWYMCEEWNENYFQFLEDMGLRPYGAKLWRYDETQPASPKNAYWGIKKGIPVSL